MADTAPTPEQPTWVGSLPWGRVTLVFHLALFALPAFTAWTSSPNATIVLPSAALPVTLVGGLLMLIRSDCRSVGVRVTAASLIAAAVEVGTTLALVAAYAAQHPGWDLS